MNKMNQKPTRREKNAGFTLIELLVVVLIIGILAAIALPEYTKAVEKSRVSDAVTQLRNLLTAQKAYKLANAGYATDLTLLDIDMPNIKSDNPKQFVTQDWVITLSIHDLSTDTFKAFAARAKNGTAITSGEYTYGILMTVPSEGTPTWKCQLNMGNPSVPAICRSITNSTDGVLQ